MLLDEADGVRRDQIRHVAVDADGRGVLEQVLEPAGGFMRVEVDRAALEPEEVVEAMLVWPELRLPSKMPLADQPGRIAVVLQQPRQRPSGW